MHGGGRNNQRKRRADARFVGFYPRCMGWVSVATSPALTERMCGVKEMPQEPAGNDGEESQIYDARRDGAHMD
jgi:hypothetical protein